MTRGIAAAGLLRFLEETTDAPEVLWFAGLAMIERAVSAAREAGYSRFRHYPAGELRRLERDTAAGFELLDLAVELQTAEDEQERELVAELQAAAAEQGRRRRRAQTLPAEQARLAK